MISSIKLYNLRNSEFIQFITDVLDIVDLNNATDLQVMGQYNDLFISKGELEHFYKKEQGSDLTNEIVKMDALRDSLITGINAIVTGNTYHYDEITKGYAVLLENNLSIYGKNIARENYQSETTIINNIVSDWTTNPVLSNAATKLGLNTWIVQLQAANSNFHSIYLQRTQEFGAASPNTLKLKRQETTNIYYELRDFIDSYFTINKGAPPFDKAINELNALIDQYNTLLAGRKLRDVSEEEFGKN
jgi:hypothetical protein